MAITFQKREKKQKYLILVFSILILAIFLTIYFGFFKGQKSPLFPSIIYKPPKIEIDFEALKKPFIKELLPFEEIKPFKAQIGRENPFLPYSP